MEKTTITLTLETIAENLAAFMKLRKNDFISLDDLRASRFAIETLIGTENYEKAMEMAKEIINA